jgi:hypothetical protein
MGRGRNRYDHRCNGLGLQNREGASCILMLLAMCARLALLTSREEPRIAFRIIILHCASSYRLHYVILSLVYFFALSIQHLVVVCESIQKWCDIIKWLATMFIILVVVSLMMVMVHQRIWISTNIVHINGVPEPINNHDREKDRTGSPLSMPSSCHP